MRAAWNGHEDIVAALVAGGADIHAVDDRGITALQRAGAENEQSIVRLLRQGRMHRAQEILVLLANGNRAVGALA
jgi:ankyrin repeat protein